MNKKSYTFPEQGSSVNDLLELIKKKKEKDINWKTGRLFCLIYHPGDERKEAIKTIAGQYYSDSALNPTATPSLVELETETVSMCADLLHGDEHVCGNITTGGTESILLAIKTARDHAREKNKKIKQPHVVIPDSVHPAFMKAFHYLDVAYTAVKTGKDMRADVAAMEKAITPDTVMLVGSAPSYPYGVIDPIADIAALAKKNNLLCHVDACVGGFFLPFINDLGYNVPPFDFAVDGVTSISADFHKYGYAPKGASLILYKTHELRRYQFSLYTKWSGGIYGSPTVTGTRPGTNIAAAWAALRTIGKDGYREMAKATMNTFEAIKTGISGIEELEIIGEPATCIIAFKSTGKLDIFMLADELNKKGWYFERQQLPPSIHLTINYIHKNVAADFLADLKQAVISAGQKRMVQLGNKLQTAMVKGLKGVLPEGAIARLQKNSPPDLKNENTAAMYGMLGALSGTNDLDTIVLDFLDSTYTAKQ